MAANCTQLYEEQFDHVYNYVYFRLRSIQETEDVVSDIFLKAVAAASSYHWRPGARQKSWLFAIVRNTLIDYYRKRRLAVMDLETAELAPHLVTDATSHDTMAVALDQQEQYQQLLTAVDQLPEREREIIILHFQAELSHQEIAQLLGLRRSSISAALTKAKQHLTNLVHQSL